MKVPAPSPSPAPPRPLSPARKYPPVSKIPDRRLLGTRLEVFDQFLEDLCIGLLGALVPGNCERVDGRRWVKGARWDRRERYVGTHRVSTIDHHW